MEKIYEILSRHFSGESSGGDKAAVEKFKKEHTLEYEMLARLWQRHDIRIKDFDADRAWKAMGLEKAKTRKMKIFTLRPAFLKFAAAAVIFIMGAAAVYYYQIYTPAYQLVTLQTNNRERGKSLVLADGTQVWLNSNAQISYPKIFRGETRITKLRGEAFFQVKKMPEHPFVIDTKNAQIEVLGTSFNVQSSENMTEVTVQTGRVKVRNSRTGKEVTINAGYTARTVNEKILKFRTKNPNYLSWKTGKFKFNNIPLSRVVKDLNSYYDKKVVIDKNKPVECNLTAKFEEISLQDIIDIIKLTCNCGVREETGRYVLYDLQSNKQ